MCYTINQLTFSKLTLQWMPAYLEMEGINPIHVRSFQDVQSVKMVLQTGANTCLKTHDMSILHLMSYSTQIVIFGHYKGFLQHNFLSSRTQ